MKSTAQLLGWLAPLFFVFPLEARTIPVNTCVANLVQIDGAVQQWALERKLMATNSYSLENSELHAYLKWSALPKCPSGGRYFPGGTVAGVPRCSVHGTVNNTIDAERTLDEFRWRGEAFRALLISICGLLALVAARKLPDAQSSTVRLGVGLVLAIAVGWCFTKAQAEAPRTNWPSLALFLYSASGVVAFVTLRRDARKGVRLLAFAGTLTMGVAALLIAVAFALAKLH